MMPYADLLLAGVPGGYLAGVPESCYGRELSAFGIREFVNVKSMYMA